MRKHLLQSLGLLVLTSTSVVAQTSSIDHQAVACAVAGKFPRLNARFAPGNAVAAARIVFRAENTLLWYSVAMKPEGPAFTGVLPQPKEGLKAFQYYIEVTDKTLGTSRTADFTTNVVATPALCQGKVVAGSLGSAAVLLQVPAGAATVPIGFAANGVVVPGRAAAAAGSGSGGAAAGAGAAAGVAGTAAGAGGGGGLSTGALVGIVAGVGAVGAGVAVTVNQLSGGGATYSGPFNGQWTVSQIVTGPNQPKTCFYTRTLSGTFSITLEESGGSATGQGQINGSQTLVEVTGGPNCNGTGPGQGMQGQCAVAGPLGNLTCQQQTPSEFGDVTQVLMLGFSGALSGGAVTGTVTYAATYDGPGMSASASTTFPVTLR